MLPCGPSQEDKPEDMGRGPSQKGIEQRRKILAELARRWENMEPELSIAVLAREMGIERNSFYHYLKDLRDLGLVHPSAVLVTPAGYAEIRGQRRLTD